MHSIAFNNDTCLVWVLFDLVLILFSTCSQYDAMCPFMLLGTISHYLNTPNKRPNSRDAAASEKPQPKMSAINFSQFANWFLSDQKDKSFNLE